MTNKSQKQRPKRTLRDHIKNFLIALIMVFLPLLLLETMLRVIDPWGIVYFDDIVLMSEHFVIDDQRLYILPDGVYYFSHWSATIENEVRLTNVEYDNPICQVVLLGDSVTFGYGVNNQDAWATVLANQYPDIEIINTGVTQYTSENVLGTYRAYPDADVYLYLVIYNDWQTTPNFGRGVLSNPANRLPRLVNYLQFLIYLKPTEEAGPFGGTDSVSNYERFYNDIASLAQDDRVTFMGFEDDTIVGVLANQGYSIELLPPYSIEYRISFVDAHLNSQGNEILAQSVAPILQSAIEAQCE